MAQAHSSKVQLVDSMQMLWEFSEWSTLHKTLVAANSSCTVNLKNPKATLRFFLQPVEKGQVYKGVSYKVNWYSLCVEIMDSPQNPNASVRVTANLEAGNVLKDGVVMLERGKGKVLQVIEEFIFLESWQVYCDGSRNANTNSNSGKNYFLQAKNARINLTLDVFHLVEENSVGEVGDAECLQAEAEVSLMNDLKKMLVSDNNFSDLKLESKDNMTLSAHKFLLAARSPYLQKLIEDATKKEDFNGSLKIEVNGKPMTAILHWMYSGELHENAGRVMEEIVEASIMFELTPLLKVLDKKLITICNEENMFRLFQVAKKNGMPTAADDISAFIRQNI